MHEQLCRCVTRCCTYHRSVLTLLQDLAVGGIVLRVQLHSYRNPSHLDTEGDRCDSLGTRTCENKFKFCLTRSSSTTCLYRIAPSSYYADDDFTFTSSVISQLGITNPLVFTNVPNVGRHLMAQYCTLGRGWTRCRLSLPKAIVPQFSF